MTKRASSSTSVAEFLSRLTNEDKGLIRALRQIREADGATYSQDLFALFSVDPDLPAADKDRAVLAELNGWLDESTPVVEIDSTGNQNLSGAIELVSIRQWRAFIDLLTSIDSGREPKLRPTSIYRDSRGVEFFTYEQMKSPQILDSERRHWASAVEAHFHTLTSHAEIALPRVTTKNLDERVSVDHEAKLVTVDLSKTFTQDFSISDVKALVSDFSDDHRIRLLAHGAVFDGEKTDFSKTVFSEVDLSWAVFNSTIVTFERSAFSAEASTEENDSGRVINFRDSTFCDRVEHIDFDFIRCTHETLKFSMEDSIVRGARISFEKAEFGSTFFDFYQAKFEKGARVQFLETDMGDSRLDFADSLFDPDETADPETRVADVIFYRIEPLPDADLAFGKVFDVRIENSTIENSLKFWGISRLSLWRTAVSGGLFKVDPDQNGSKMWFLDTIQRAHEKPRRRDEIANEFAVLKEVFHGQGEYELEDEAFVRYMRFKQPRKSANRVVAALRRLRFGYRLLDTVGRFGTAPGKIASWFLGTWLACLFMNFLILPGSNYSLPSEFGQRSVDAIINTSAGLLQANPVIGIEGFVPNALWLFQSLVGWFFLGYFFSALIRKTLR
jgi:hypothetical protein